MASNELVRVAENINSAVRQFQNALDLTERALRAGVAHDVATELNGLPAGEVVSSDLTKERVQNLAVLGANIIFYLRSINDGGSNTILGGAPLSAAAMTTLVDETGV